MSLFAACFGGHEHAGRKIKVVSVNSLLHVVVVSGVTPIVA